jgi:hypothetical protein
LAVEKRDGGRRRIAVVSCGELVAEGDEEVLLIFNLDS